MQDSCHVDYEELSLKLVALQFYSDELTGLNCATCPATTQCDNNCKMESDSKFDSLFYNELIDIDIDTCPLNCIFMGHYSFYDKYVYYTTTSAQMPSYENCDANFWRLYRKFDSYKNILETSRIKK